MKVMIVLILFPFLGFSQSKIDFGRYTKVWVMDKDSSRPKYKTDENNLITNNSPVTVSKLNNLSIFIPNSNSVVLNNGNKYILGYLINSSSDTIFIDRCDATIYPAETQILVNSQWKTFQISQGSTCGNSYFKGTLLPKSYYILHIERPKEGNINTAFRVKFKFNNTEYYSNTTNIKLTKDEILKAGIQIKPFSM